MRKLLSSPAKMPLTATEKVSYQTILKNANELLLNLMAIKVDHHPNDFLPWCETLLTLSQEALNFELLEENQLPYLKKMQEALELAISSSQLKMLRVAPWPIFSSFIAQQSQRQSLEERLRLLSYVEKLKHTSLADMSIHDRLCVAGKHSSDHDYCLYDFDIEWFGTTKGAKTFHRLLAEQPQAFDSALAHIPLEGDVAFEQYQLFVQAYKTIFSEYKVDKEQGEKAPLAPATRLLAMRRPDYFVALTNAKIDALCMGFSIVKFGNADFGGYWHELIGTIRTCAWWHAQCPIDDNEKALWQARALLVDVFFYADKQQANKSNYLRLRDKAQNKKQRNVSTTTRVKRTKETAEMLVDKALGENDLPDYLLKKRDSIVNQVKNGKSVEQAIGLMRAIFG